MKGGALTPELARLREQLSEAQSVLTTQRHAIAEHRAEIVRLEGLLAACPPAPLPDRACLEPVPRLADACTSVDQARALLAEVTEHLACALEERDALVGYVLERAPDAPERAERERLPQTRRSLIRRLRIGQKGEPDSISAHLFMGFYDDAHGGGLGELFISLGRENRCGPVGGGFHLAAKFGSVALQHGAQWQALARQCRYQRDSSGGRPYGADGLPIKGVLTVHSLTDYIGRTIEIEMAARPAVADAKRGIAAW